MPPAQYVHVQMVNALSAMNAVVYHRPKPMFAQRLFYLYDLHHGLEHLPDQFVITGPQRKHVGNVFLWDDKIMFRGLRVLVLDDKDVVAFIYFIRGGQVRQNFAE